MAHFPQMLSTACVAQYPLARRRRLRTIRNDTVDGRRFVLADAGASWLEWDLTWAGLTEVELALLRDFFAAREGRLETFVFLDPMGNLLARSEELEEPPWENGPLLAFVDGIADPLGNTRATRLTNAAAAMQALTQEVDAPGDYQLCMSLWARSASPVNITLRRTAGAGSQTQLIRSSTMWTRFEFPSKLSSTTAPSTLAVELPAGAIVELFGLQAEAQPAASTYQKSTATGGVFTARFAQDQLALTAAGLDNFGARVRVRARVEG